MCTPAELIAGRHVKINVMWLRRCLSLVREWTRAKPDPRLLLSSLSFSFHPSSSLFIFTYVSLRWLCSSAHLCSLFLYTLLSSPISTQIPHRNKYVYSYPPHDPLTLSDLIESTHFDHIILLSPRSLIPRTLRKLCRIIKRLLNLPFLNRPRVLLSLSNYTRNTCSPASISFPLNASKASQWEMKNLSHMKFFRMINLCLSRAIAPWPSLHSYSLFMLRKYRQTKTSANFSDLLLSMIFMAA